MPDLIAAADETAANKLVQQAQAALGTLPESGSDSLGPFTVSWAASANFTGGTVDLRVPDIVRIEDMDLNYALNLSLKIDLNDILPEFCLPRVCIDIPFDGRICTPKICIPWPSLPPIPIGYSDSLTFTADFRLNPHLVGTDWLIDIEIVDIPSLNIGPAAAAILVAIGTAASVALLAVPFIGPFLAGAVLAITAAIGIAGVTGLLGPILSLFVSGLSFNIYKQPKLFEVVSASGPLDPAVNVNLDAISAEVQASDEDELVISVDISP
jgi:hypothetical protein